MTRALALILVLGVARAATPVCEIEAPAPAKAAALRWNESPGLWLSDAQTVEVARRLRTAEEQAIAAKLEADAARAQVVVAKVSPRIPRWVYFTGGLVLGGGVAYYAAKKLAGDERVPEPVVLPASPLVFAIP